MNRITFLIVTYFLYTTESASKNDVYSGYTVYGIKLRDKEDQIFLLELEDQLSLDLWDSGHPGSDDALLMLSPEDRPGVLRRLDDQGFSYYLHLDDVSRSLNEHDEKLAKWRGTRSRSSRLAPFEDYPRYAEVDAYLERIAAQYPDIVTLVNAGLSFEGRAIKYLKISTTNFANSSKPIYYMDAMIHAREWVTTPVALYSIHRLVEDLRTQDQDLLEDIDWIILPIVNPDGYEYSHTDERMWRRTRSFYPDQSTTCYGVDGNRNFNVDFNTVGVQSNPCSNTFPGYEAFSEPETRIVRDILHEHVDRIQIYQNIHSHGNWLLFGHGNGTMINNGMEVHIYHVAASMGAVMDRYKLPQATYYRIGNSGSILALTSGSAQDYGFYAGVPFSYTLELPGYGYNFLVPPEFINHITSETWEGIVASARLARSYYHARGSLG